MAGNYAGRFFRRPIAGLFALALLFVPALASGAEEMPGFFLDLDTGGHRAFVKDIAFTPDGDYLVSASDDKTIRIWDWRSGVTIRTLRGFIGAGNEGKIFAIAVSPDGKTIAAGGYFGPGMGDKPPYGDVRLFDFATGKLRNVLHGPELALYDLAFSADGAFLAAGGQDGFVYVWKRGENDGWVPYARLDADSWHIQRLAFAAGGTRLAATTTDNGIRLWDLANQAEIAMPEAEALRDIAVEALAVSSDGSLFATGGKDGQVQIWRASDGKLSKAMPRLGFEIGSLVFASGDSRLVASCGYRCTDRHRSEVLTIADGQVALRYAGNDGTVVAGAANADGTLVATAGGTRHAIHVWDPATGETKALLQGIGRPVTAVGIDAAGSRIAWGTTNPCLDRIACPEVQGILETRLVLPSPDLFFDRPGPIADDERYQRAVHATDSWMLEAAAGGERDLDNAVLEISHDGKQAGQIANDATNGYLHAAFTLIKDGHGLITGGNDGTLIEYDSATARHAGEFLGGHTGEVSAMAAATRRNLLVTGSADQTIRLWNIDTRELVVSMFFAGDEFVIWVPQGYYYSSDDGDNLIGWHVNQGADGEGRFVRAGQLKRYLWSPELVRRAIILGSAKQAITEMRPGVDNELKRLLERRPPEFEARLAEDQSNVRDGFVAVEIVGAEEAGTDVADFAILSNNRNIGQFTARSVAGDGKRTIIEVPVDDGENRIRITGTNTFGYLTERSVVALAKKKDEKRKGRLFLVAIGVEKYPLLPSDCNGRSCDLRYPVDDAAELVRVIAERSAPLYAGMETLVLVNRTALDETPDAAKALGAAVDLDGMLEPESDNISDQIEDFLDRPGPDDTTIVFVAGHGINIDEDYYFVPSDGRKQDGDRWKRSSLVDWADIQKAVERAQGVRFMLLDTCHAANSFNPRLEKEAADARIVVFSATAANSTAAELPELGHGVFTYSVLQGLRGAANTSGDGVRLLGLADFIYREVIRLTGAQQKPFYFISNMENILLARP